MFLKSDQEYSIGPDRLGSLLSVFQSANEEEITLGQRGKSAAKAYIYAYEDAPETYAVEVFFFVKSLEKGFRYTYEKGAVPRFRLRIVEDQALEFVESLGFMMDNMQIHGLAPQQRHDLIGALPMFIGTGAAVSAPKSKHNPIDRSGVSGPTEREEKEHASQKIAKLFAGF